MDSFIRPVTTCDEVATVTFETETWLKFRDETETKTSSKNPRLETSKFRHFVKI